MILRRLFAALLLALMLPNPASAEAPVRVVIFEELTEPPPKGLPLLHNAVVQLENEFGPTATEISALAEKYEIAQAEAQKPNAAGVVDQEAIDRATQLGRDLQYKSDNASAAYQRRQEQVINPLVQKVDQDLQRYGEATGSEVFLLGWQEFNAEAPGTLQDVTAAFVAWMGSQP